MKYVIVFACLLAVICAAPASVRFFTLSSTQQLSLYSISNLNTPQSTISVTGVLAGEFLIDITFHSNNKLYAISRNNNNDSGSLYTIDVRTGVAHRVGALAGCSLYSYPDLLEPRYAFDYDPQHKVFRLVGEDTQHYIVDPATGACTKKTNLFYNGPSGRGSTPTRAVAFTDNISGANSTEWILSGVHIGFINVPYPESNGVYKVSEGFYTKGSLDILTRKVGNKHVDIPVAITAPYNADTYSFDYNNLQLYTFSLNTTFSWTPREKQVIGSFPSSSFSDSVRCFGLAVLQN